MKKLVSKISIASVVALGLAACASPFNGANHVRSVAEEHPISVDSQVVTLTISADASTTELSNVDKSRLRAFANAYLTSGHGPLTVTAPSGYADAEAHEAAADIRAVLHEAGVPWDALTGATYRTGGDAGDQLIISYSQYVATPSECGVWTGMTARGFRNLRTPNFGCSTQNNLAAMVADPRDLVEPAALAPRDSMARDRALGNYRLGETTSSAAEEIETELAE